jgi:hypothetical protein
MTEQEESIRLTRAFENQLKAGLTYVDPYASLMKYVVQEESYQDFLVINAPKEVLKEFFNV